MTQEAAVKIDDNEIPWDSTPVDQMRFSFKFHTASAPRTIWSIFFLENRFFVPTGPWLWECQRWYMDLILAWILVSCVGVQVLTIPVLWAIASTSWEWTYQNHTYNNQQLCEMVSKKTHRSDVHCSGQFGRSKVEASIKKAFEKRLNALVSGQEWEKYFQEYK